MAYNISDIKKLPVRERLRIINELWKSIDKEVAADELVTEEDNILKERWEKYQSGKMEFDTWANVKKRLQEKVTKPSGKNGKTTSR